MLAVLGRIVGEAEEGGRQRGGRGIVGGNEPACAIAQPVAPVIGRTVQSHHVEPFLDQRDERQEMLAVEPVLVEILRRPVRRRHHRDTLIEQRGEQDGRSEEHTSELQSLMRISYAGFWLKKKKKIKRELTEERGSPHTELKLTQQ